MVSTHLKNISQNGNLPQDDIVFLMIFMFEIKIGEPEKNTVRCTTCSRKPTIFFHVFFSESFIKFHLTHCRYRRLQQATALVGRCWEQVFTHKLAGFPVKRDVSLESFRHIRLDSSNPFAAACVPFKKMR